jgi:hypothetical protein
MMGQAVLAMMALEDLQMMALVAHVMTGQVEMVSSVQKFANEKTPTTHFNFICSTKFC